MAVEKVSQSDLKLALLMGDMMVAQMAGQMVVQYSVVLLAA